MTIITEIAIIGTGPAGIAAALSAARLGHNVVLVGNRPLLGGNSSSEIRVWARGAVGGGNLFAEEMGVWGEVKLRNLLLNPSANPVEWDDVLLEQVCAEENIRLLLNTHITTLSQDTNGSICNVSGFQMGTEEEVQISALYYMDCTGDGSLGAQAGVPFRMGKEGRDVYEESLAPLQDEQGTFGSTIFFYTEKRECPMPYTAPDFAYDMEKVESLIGHGGRIVNERLNGCDYWWFEIGGTQNTITDAQDIAFALRQLVLGVWNYIKNSGKFPADNLELSWVGTLPGKRESRRMKTETVFTQQDILDWRQFEDIGFYGGWYMDMHPSDGVHTDEDFCIQIPVQIYGIPLSTLYSHIVPNLLFAGRDIGISHTAFSSTRIMNTCALSGQAAATLIHECLNYKATPSALDKAGAWAVQQTLLRQDMLVPGVVNEDPEDLARSALLSTDGGCSGSSEDENGIVCVYDETFIVVPFGGGMVSFLLEADEETILTYTCYRSDLPSRLSLGEDVGHFCPSILKGRCWQTLPIPNCEDGFCTIRFAAADVRIVTAVTQLTGVLGGQTDSPHFWYPCVRIEKAEDLYGVHNLINGSNRPWKAPNAWVSEPITSPAVELRWQIMQTISRIVLYANPDLSLELTSSHPGTWSEHHKFAAREQMPPQLLREAEVYAWIEGGWQLAAHIKDNWRRKIEIPLEFPICTNKIKVVCISNYGAKTSELFEIRIY